MRINRDKGDFVGSHSGLQTSGQLLPLFFKSRSNGTPHGIPK